jgi:heme exporter protein B
MSDDAEELRAAVATQPVLAESRAEGPAGILKATLIIIKKDLLIEWRTRARLNALIFFAMATLLMFSFALGPDTVALRRNASGYLWLGILFASVLSLGESFRIETENLALDGLRLAPADPRAVFLGKAIGNTVMLWVLSMVITPVTVALYDVTITEGILKLSGVLLMGCIAISAPGTFYAAIASNARARDVLLPLLLFPVLIPSLLASVKATGLVMTGDPMGQLDNWLMLLAGFNVLYWGLGFALFPRVIEDD